MSKGHVLAVVGAQYGSEGKGVIVNHLAPKYDVHVRVGGPNAGHSFYHNGQKHVQQVIPCGWTNPNARLILGRGMLINPEILLKEIEELQKVDPNIRERIRIDAKAGCLDPKFHTVEGGVHGELHQRIGSTGEGVGAARVARMNRDSRQFELMESVAKKWGLEDMMQHDTPTLLWEYLRTGSNVLLEGTQGSGLSLIHGPWPFVTSHDTNAAQMAADAGLAPQLITKTLLVARTFPIRVAGNSGPLHKELSWEEMSKKVGRPIEERTTVTKKVRRVGEWDEELLDSSISLNRPSSIAITFMDYLNPKDEGVHTPTALSELSKRFIDYVERRFQTRVSMVGTGGPVCSVVELEEV